MDMTEVVRADLRSVWEVAGGWEHEPVQVYIVVADNEAEAEAKCHQMLCKDYAGLFDGDGKYSLHTDVLYAMPMPLMCEVRY